MQSVRFVMREIGTMPNAISPEAFAEYVEYKFLALGYKIWKQSETPVVDGAHGFQGYRVLLTLVKNDGDEANVGAGSEEVQVEPEKKRGRPAKAS